jgi:hypothetical protein
MNTTSMEQLELSFTQRRLARPTSPTFRARRASRAHWWFRQMRRVVDHVLDRTPTPTPSARPEQIYLGMLQS